MIKEIGGSQAHAQSEFSKAKSTRLFASYQREADRHQSMIRKTERAKKHSLFIVDAWRHLLLDEHFITLLRAENLGNLPRYLYEKIQAPRAVAKKTGGREILDFVFLRSYLLKLLQNQAVTSYLRQHHPDVINEFAAIAQMKNLDSVQQN